MIHLSRLPCTVVITGVYNRMSGEEICWDVGTLNVRQPHHHSRLCASAKIARDDYYVKCGGVGYVSGYFEQIGYFSVRTSSSHSS